VAQSHTTNAPEVEGCCHAVLPCDGYTVTQSYRDTTPRDAKVGIRKYSSFWLTFTSHRHTVAQNNPPKLMKITSKQADALAAKLTTAMQRNTTLATGKGSTQAAGPVATYTPQPPEPRPMGALISGSPKHPSGRRSGIRLKADDDAKIREIIQAGFAFQENLTATDAIRLALRAYGPKHLTQADIAQIRAKDGRSNAGTRAVAP